MLGRTHTLAGALCGEVAAILSHAPPAIAVGGVVVGIVSALVPDIDHSGSTISHRIPLGWVVGAALKHRGVTHSLFASFLWWALWARWLVPHLHIPAWWAVAALDGYLSHLLLDGATKDGVPLLWPIPKRFSLRLLKTGAAAEVFAVAPVLMVLIAWAGWVLVRG